MSVGPVMISVHYDPVLLKKAPFFFVHLVLEVTSPGRIIRRHIITDFMCVQKIAAELRCLFDDLICRDKCAHNSCTLHLWITGFYSVAAVVIGGHCRVIILYSVNYVDNLHEWPLILNTFLKQEPDQEKWQLAERLSRISTEISAIRHCLPFTDQSLEILSELINSRVDRRVLYERIDDIG